MPKITRTRVADWELEQTNGTPGLDATNDASSSNGTPIGARIQGGIYLQSLEFTGPGQYLNVPRTLELEPMTGFTLSMWVFPTQINSGTTYVLMNKGGTSQDYRLYIDPHGFLIFHIQDLTATNFIPTVTPTPPANTADILGPQLPLNTWTHIGAVYDPVAGIMKLYLDGTLVTSKLITGTIAYNTTGALTLSDPTNPFYGMMDEVSIYG